MRSRSLPYAPTGPRPLTPADAEALAHVAQDADGTPLPDAALAFLGEDVGDVLRVEGERLVVLGVAMPRYYALAEVRAAVDDARRVWRVVHRAGGGG